MDGIKARQIYRNWVILKSVNQKCIETYFRFMCLLLLNRKLLLKRITAEKVQRWIKKKCRRFKMQIGQRSERSQQIESNDAFKSTAIGKQADSKCIQARSVFATFWLLLNSTINQTRSIFVVFFFQFPFEFTWPLAHSACSIQNLHPFHEKRNAMRFLR